MCLIKPFIIVQYKAIPTKYAEGEVYKIIHNNDIYKVKSGEHVFIRFGNYKAIITKPERTEINVEVIKEER